jgi:acetoin utilization protein AcuC
MNPATTKTALIYSDAWTRFDYGPQHPLRMERLGLTWRLMQAYNLTTLPQATVRAPEPAPESAIAVYHATDYLEMLKASNSGQAPAAAARFGLGPGDNPAKAKWSRRRRPSRSP